MGGVRVSRQRAGTARHVDDAGIWRFAQERQHRLVKRLTRALEQDGTAIRKGRERRCAKEDRTPSLTGWYREVPRRIENVSYMCLELI